MAALSDPITLARGPEWPSRFALAPMTNRQSHADGTLGDDELRWLERRASGGFGLVMTCAAHVAQEGQAWPGQLGVWSDAHVAGLTRLAEAIRHGGARAAIQLHHGGRRADPAVTRELVAPWDDEETGARALATAEVEGVVEQFVRAAMRADQAGFDGVEIHGAHGYLVSQFLDADHNHRSDGYGETPAGRSRFLTEILAGIRSNARPDFQVGLRLTPERWGIRLPEAKALAQDLLLSGLVDFLDMSLWDVSKLPEGSSSDGRRLIEHFLELDRGSTRLGFAGKILSSARAQHCLDLGADFVTIGMGGILHHDFASRAIANPQFVAVTPPVSADYLLGESLSNTFIEYLKEIRKGLVGSP